MHHFSATMATGSGAHSLDVFEVYVRYKVEVDRISHQQLSDDLKAAYSGSRGFSVRSIQRFCVDKGIHESSRLSSSELEQVVSTTVAKVCSSSAM